MYGDTSKVIAKSAQKFLLPNHIGPQTNLKNCHDDDRTLQKQFGDNQLTCQQAAPAGCTLMTGVTKICQCSCPQQVTVSPTGGCHNDDAALAKKYGPSFTCLAAASSARGCELVDVKKMCGCGCQGHRRRRVQTPPATGSTGNWYRLVGIEATCCESAPANDCSKGPTMCTVACAKLIVPFEASCGALMKTLPPADFHFTVADMETFVTSCRHVQELSAYSTASTCAADPKQKQRRVIDVNTACCTQGGKHVCHDGTP